MIAAMTAIISIAVVSVVWNQHFQTYAYENMQSLATNTAEQIAARYEVDGSFTQRVLAPASSVVAVNPGIGMQVVDENNVVLYDSTTATDSSSDEDEGVVPSLAPRQSQSNMARAAIIVDNHAIGSVRVWVYGSDTMLRSSDVEFRDNSYRAMFSAAAIAIVLASLIGNLFARNLVRPIKRMTDTAAAIKEGNLEARTHIIGDDEVSQLGETFDAMADSIERDRALERRLTTDVAHELRTPLMAIQATVEAMVDNVFPADEEHLLTVDAEVQRLSRLVDSLLKLSRLENRSNPNKKVPLNVGDVVSGIIATHEAYVSEAGLTLEYKADPDVIILGDDDLIRQATANLISNAVRYTPEGGHITVTVSRGATMASIAVQDTGIGLTPEEARMVFSRFWRADSGRDRDSGGLGIGLSVVKEIVDRHGGWVQVEGRKGEGSCFTIHIPLYDENVKKRRNDDKRKDSKNKSNRNSGSGKTGKTDKMNR